MREPKIYLPPQAVLDEMGMDKERFVEYIRACRAQRAETEADIEAGRLPRPEPMHYGDDIAEPVLTD